MRTSLVAGIVALTAFAPVLAHAAPPLTDERRCGFFSTGSSAEGWQTGEVDGGPLAIGARTGYLTCTIQVGDSTHSGADACSVTGAVTFGVVAAAGTCSYTAGTNDLVYLCTQVTLTGPVAETWYWDENAWSRDPGSSCAVPL